MFPVESLNANIGVIYSFWSSTMGYFWFRFAKEGLLHFSFRV